MTQQPQTATAQPLTSMYDVALLDLDGVVYAGADPIVHASESLAAAAAHGMHLAYVTNNASRTPAAVQAHLADVGVTTTVEQIITSAQVAARVLHEHIPPGSTVLVLGDTGLRTAVTDEGFVVVDTAADQPTAVAQGISPTTTSTQFAEAVVAIRNGAVWVASNTDSTLPSPRGPLPGNGAYVELVARTLGRGPDVVAGKPDPTMHAETVRRTAASHPLVVGDRLDTDIEGANRAGCDSLLVLTGIASPSQLITAEAKYRPTYISADLRGLLVPPRIAQAEQGRWRLGGWWAEPGEGVTRIGANSHSGGGDSVDLLIAICAAVWSGAPSNVQSTDEPSATAISTLGLTES